MSYHFAIGSVGVDFLVPKIVKDLENLAPRWEHPPTLLLILVHGQHELHFRFCILSLTRCRVNKPASATELSRVGGPGGLF